MQKKAVIFDMDGVLIDTEKYLTKFWCQAAREYGFPMELCQAYEIRSLSGEFGRNKLQEFFGESFDYETIRNRRKSLMNEHLSVNGVEPKPYVKEALNILMDSGYVLAVATSTDSFRTEKYLKDIKVYEMFDKVICANMVKQGKPCPDIYLYACDELGLGQEDCVAVEDSYNGILSATGAGLTTYMIPDLTDVTEREKQHIEASFNNLLDFANYMKALK